MKTSSTFVVAAFAAALTLAGCQNAGQRQTLGTLLGAGAGAAIGSQIGSGRGQLAAVAVGTLLGAVIGSELGAALDAQDRQLASRAETQAHSAPIGEPIEWSNPDSGHHGTVTAIRDGREKDTNDYCREYQTDVVVSGRVETAYGTACQRPNGDWEIVS